MDFLERLARDMEAAEQAERRRESEHQMAQQQLRDAYMALEQAETDGEPTSRLLEAAGRAEAREQSTYAAWNKAHDERRAAERRFHNLGIEIR